MNAPYLFGSATLDGAGDGSAGPVARAWFESAVGVLLAGLRDRVESGDGSYVGSCMVSEAAQDPMRSRRFSPAAWRRLLDRLTSGAGLPDHADVSFLPDVGVEYPPETPQGFVTLIRQPDDPTWVSLSLQGVDLGRATVEEVSDRWMEFFCQVLAGADPAFGGVTEDVMLPFESALDYALFRSSLKSIEQSREWLRGYAWITVCPKELVPGLGGAERLRETGAFAQVRELGSGAVILRATRSVEDFDDGALYRVFTALAPVLPAGRPRPVAGYEHLRVVYEDAAQYR